jgi:hypothetical protein
MNTPRRMSIRTKLIIGAILVGAIILHARGVALIMSASDASPAGSATVLRGD